MDKTMKTPLEDLRKQALEHYEEAATAIVHYNSFVRDAIMAYDPEQKLLQHLHRCMPLALSKAAQARELDLALIHRAMPT